MMTVLEFLVVRSTFTLIVMGVVIAIGGIPKKKARYRMLVFLGCIFSIGAVVEWYVHLVIAEKYFRDESHWYFFPLAALFVIAAVLFTWELATLRFFTRLRRHDEESG